MMKKIIYIILAYAFILTSCRDLDQPYVGYIKVDRVVLEYLNGVQVVPVDTDISAPVTARVDEEAAGWCKVEVQGKELVVSVTENTSDQQRFATVSLRSGYKTSSFQIIQKKQGANFLEYLPTGWSASASSVQANDGGGTEKIFTDLRTEFWHSQYSPEPVPPPHWIVVDMKEEKEVGMIRLGWRQYGDKNYATVKVVEVLVSTDGESYTSVGEIHKEAPNGTSNADYPAYDQVEFELRKVRFIRVLIKETNTANGTCQVAYVKAYEVV